MADLRMSTLFAIFFVVVLAGLSHGADKDCSNIDEAKVLTKMMECISKKPKYFLVVLTKMRNPASMESPDFMCSNPDMMADLVECALNYAEGCMPSGVSQQVDAIKPSPATVTKAVKLLCQHRNDFKNPCVVQSVQALVGCISSKMQTFTSTSARPYGNVQQALCTALSAEKQCLDSTLSSCPTNVKTDLMEGLLAFFPSEKCTGLLEKGDKDNTLYYKPSNRVSHLKPVHGNLVL